MVEARKAAYDWQKAHPAHSADIYVNLEEAHFALELRPDAMDLFEKTKAIYEKIWQRLG